MALLLGMQPGTLSNELKENKPIPVPPKKIATGVPADILRQRPDIRSAERKLAAQTARIGIAKADLYPSFSLLGSIGYQSFDTSDFFSPDSFFFQIGPSVRWNFFQGGRVRQQIKVEDARTEQLLLTYEKTILNALNEVENAFTSYIQQRIQYDYLKKSVKSSKKSLKIATNLYSQGLTDFQNVLDAQRELITSENNMIDAKGKSSINLVRLYKALGGGWNPEQIENGKRGNYESEK
jgi:NodT family efflux transporter outer membrane factor (OMF) lipoprotein